MNNKIAIKLLKHARIRIDNRSYYFLCNALISAARGDNLSTATDNTLALLLDWIRLQLGGVETFGIYLENLGVTNDCIRYDQRPARLQWIDNMITSLKNNEVLGTQCIDNLKF